jgi:hypothetical protein
MYLLYLFDRYVTAEGFSTPLDLLSALRLAATSRYSPPPPVDFASYVVVL